MGLDQRLLATFAVAILLLGFIYAIGGDQSTKPSPEANLVGFNQVDASCGGPNADVSLDAETTETGDQLITVIGALSTPNPCYRVEGDLERMEDGLALQVISESEGGMCVQCVGQVSYEAQIEASGFDNLAVYHDGQQIKQFSLTNSD